MKSKIESLQKHYKELLLLEDSDDGIFDFKDELLSSDEEEVLEFHFKILKDKNDEYLQRDLFAFFSDRRDKESAGEFLYKKYKDGIDDIGLRANVIQLSGHLRGKHTRDIALENMVSLEWNLRYSSIIVLGWVGSKTDLKVLNERLLTDPDPQLRGYAATAMRQIWFNHPKTKDDILRFIKDAIEEESAQEAIEGLVITAQDLLKKKLGLKESKYGEVTGDMDVAKNKTIEALKSY
ncbi:HEAT repeat domain-containing protein [Pedobacter caeni]|uniref:HEAT repeat-containing protein n=1 Tax=Pedobacter caeni TaxID=288992 RepID=A0A1M5H0X5_9SPHI|nr:HEAT repeat domain-containing protein [Pedobacter caeni]SHG09597.1 hypothetical protein SAMN04488522_104455 [Pedobacter caeni]